jgi:hypothetical protein
LLSRHAEIELDPIGNARFICYASVTRRILLTRPGSHRRDNLPVNATIAKIVNVAMKPTRIVRRRREVQAYYGSAQSDRSRLPFLLEPPAPANAFASMVSSWNTVAALRKTVGRNLMPCGWIQRKPERKFGFT